MTTRAEGTPLSNASACSSVSAVGMASATARSAGVLKCRKRRVRDREGLHKSQEQEPEYPCISVRLRRSLDQCLVDPGAFQSFGTRIGTDGALPRTPGLDQREYRAMESFQGCKICGCWDLKRVFRVNRIRRALGSWPDRRRALRRRRETSVEGHLSVLLALKLVVIGGVRPGRRRPFQNVLCLLPRRRR